MASSGDARQYGKVFNEIASDYDRNRPGYPNALVDEAVSVAGLVPGSAVLEVGCGTGQLTRSLLARGLRVTAVEPGAKLLELARANLKDAAEVEFINARLEDAELPQAHFQAVFSASAFHWPDPDLSWRIVAETLAPAGTLALIQYFGVDDEYGNEDRAAGEAAMRAVSPELAAEWPEYRTMSEMLAGAEERKSNVSELWGWLGTRDLGRDYAAALFDDASLATIPIQIEQSAESLNALLSTMSFWSRLDQTQQQRIQQDNRELEARLGRKLRASIAACLVTAQRHD